MNIAMIHFRTGATDGVSLEMDKWREVLEELGHKVIYISGDNNRLPGYVIKELDLNELSFKNLFENSFVKLVDFESEELLKEKIDASAISISEQLNIIIKEEKIDLIIPNNVSSLGLSLAAGKAIAMSIDQTKVKVIFHHHDFFWERERYSKPTASFVSDYLKAYFPYKGENIIHCVINKIAQTELKSRFNLDSMIVPNVIDFAQPKWIINEHNQTLKQKLEIKNNDLVFLQATRVEDRKAIELAIDTLDAVESKKHLLENNLLFNGKVFSKDSNIYLIVAGLNELRSDKFIELKKKCDNSKVKVLFINEMIVARHQELTDRFTLFDTYTIADFVTYPSILEGWGNQLIEALFAKKPVLIYEYPVFLSDIKDKGINLVSLGNTHYVDKNGLVKVKPEIIDHASSQIIKILLNKELYRAITEENYDIASREFSYDKLRAILKSILDDKITLK
jgi:glycosyltransferase involved in cell wall biosynthesis